MDNELVMGFITIGVFGAMLGYAMATYIMRRRFVEYREALASMFRRYRLKGSDWCSMPVRDIESLLEISLEKTP